MRIENWTTSPSIRYDVQRSMGGRKPVLVLVVLNRSVLLDTYDHERWALCSGLHVLDARFDLCVPHTRSAQSVGAPETSSVQCFGHVPTIIAPRLRGGCRLVLYRVLGGE